MVLITTIVLQPESEIRLYEGMFLTFYAERQANSLSYTQILMELHSHFPAMFPTHYLANNIACIYILDQ